MGPPDPGIKPTSLTSPAVAGGFFTTSATWETPFARVRIKALRDFPSLPAPRSPWRWPLSTQQVNLSSPLSKYLHLHMLICPPDPRRTPGTWKPSISQGSSSLFNQRIWVHCVSSFIVSVVLGPPPSPHCAETHLPALVRWASLQFQELWWVGQGRAQGHWGKGRFLQGECKPRLCPGESSQSPVPGRCVPHKEPLSSWI